jgi:predicted MFS family arabinose efflux permease
VDEGNASNAFALNAAAMSATLLLAPTLAGNLYNLIGADGVYYTIGGLQLVAAFLTGMVSAKDTPAEKQRRSRTFREIKLGFQYIGRNKLIIVLMVISAGAALMAMPFYSLLPIYIVDVFQRGPETLGFMLSIMGVGAITGSLLVASLGERKRGWLLIIGGVTSGIGMIMAGVIPYISVVSVTLFVVGAGNALRNALTMAMVMELTEPEYQGRVSSVYAANFGLTPLGVFPASVVTEYFGVKVAVIGLGVILLLMSIYIGAASRDLRRLS